MLLGVCGSGWGVVDILVVRCKLCAIWHRGVVVDRDRLIGGLVGDGGVMVGRLVQGLGFRYVGDGLVEARDKVA